MSKQTLIDGAVCQVCEGRQQITMEKYRNWGTSNNTHCGKQMYIHIKGLESTSTNDAYEIITGKKPPL